MVKAKLFKKAADKILKETDITAEEANSADCVTYRKWLDDTVVLYMSQHEWKRQCVNHVINTSSFDKKIPTALEIYQSIIKYRTAKKSKNDLTKKAFIDMGDGLALETAIKYGGSKQRQTNESTVYIARYIGNICIPFSDCFVYTIVPDAFGQVVEIKDNKDGTYSGNSFICIGVDLIIQYSFIIRPYKNCWLIAVKLEHGKRPLGQVMSNISSIIYTALSNSKLVDRKSAVDYINKLIEVLCDSLLYVFKYFDYYKDKTVYKSDNIYIYGDNIEDYMKKNYPGRNYEQLKGWLIKGYWKQINGMGKDADGKPIRNLDWIVPYSNIRDTQMTSNEQSTRLVPIHAVDRAEQRYNVELSDEDLNYILKQCLEGKCKKLSVRDKFGRLCTAKGKKGCYRINYKNKWLDFVVVHYDNKYRIATFLPEPKDVNYTIIDSKIYNDIISSYSEKVD